MPVMSRANSRLKPSIQKPSAMPSCGTQPISQCSDSPEETLGTREQNQANRAAGRTPAARKKNGAFAFGLPSAAMARYPASA